MAAIVKQPPHLGHILTQPRQQAWVIFSAIALSLSGCQSITDLLPSLPSSSSVVQPSPSKIAQAQTPAIAEMETRVRQQINQIREEQGLEPLTVNERLAQVARRYSQQMAQHDFFSHTGIDGSDVGDRVRAAGIAYWMVGENLFMSANALQPVPLAVQGWMESPGHRENILRSEYRETGIGIWREGNRYYFTQLFLRSPSLPNLFKSLN